MLEDDVESAKGWSSSKKLILLAEEQPGIYLFSRREDGDQFDAILADAIALAVRIRAFDLNLNADTSELRIEVRSKIPPGGPELSKWMPEKFRSSKE